MLESSIILYWSTDVIPYLFSCDKLLVTSVIIVFLNLLIYVWFILYVLTGVVCTGLSSTGLLSSCFGVVTCGSSTFIGSDGVICPPELVFVLLVVTDVVFEELLEVCLLLFELTLEVAISDLFWLFFSSCFSSITLSCSIWVVSFISSVSFSCSSEPSKITFIGSSSSIILFSSVLVYKFSIDLFSFVLLCANTSPTIMLIVNIVPIIIINFFDFFIIHHFPFLFLFCLS